MIRISRFKFIVLIGVLITSCRKNIVYQSSTTKPTDFIQVFEEFWNKMNTNYVYWDDDSTDWDAVYKEYYPLFKKLNKHDEEDIKKSVNYFRQMTNGLIDCHYSIHFLPNAIADSFVFPALDRKLIQKDFHSPFDYLSIDSNYFDKNFITGTYSSSTVGQSSATCGTIQNKILYFSCTNFDLREAYFDVRDNPVKSAIQLFFNQIHDLPSNIKALTIDVRNNRGGNLEDLSFLIGQMIDKPLSFGYTHYKSGNGRLAYTPWINAFVSPQTNGQVLSIPIFVLADNYSVSLAEAVVMAIHAMPKSTIIGEVTWGATGPIANEILYNDGQFTISNFLSVYTSSAAFRYIDNKRYEGKGFPPDILVPFNLTSLIAGVDLQLEKAISLVR